MTDRVLKTLNGSTIKRSRLGVGKEIGGTIYLHRNYEDLIPDQDLLNDARDILTKEYLDFNYNVIKYSPKQGRVTFVLSPDFDLSDEPISGHYVAIINGRASKKGYSGSIWHHKWLWVRDDYRGFDVEASFQRSKLWLQIPEIDFSRIGSKSVWESDYLPIIERMAKKEQRDQKRPWKSPGLEI